MLVGSAIQTEGFKENKTDVNHPVFNQANPK
jgi:hypothetical protein